MNQVQIEFLKTKLAATQSHLDDQEDKKKALVGGFNDEIKATKKRIKCYAKTISIDCDDLLGDIFDETEWSEFSRMK